MGRVWCWLWLGLPNLSCRLDKCSVMRGVCTHGEGGSFWRLRPPALRSLIQSRRHDVHINHTHWHEVRHTAQPGINSSPTHPQKKKDGHAQTTEDHKLSSLLKSYWTALHHLLHDLTRLHIVSKQWSLKLNQTSSTKVSFDWLIQHVYWSGLNEDDPSNVQSQHKHNIWF